MSIQTIKATKLPIVENKALKGGLTNSVQRYSIYYLFPLVENNIVKYSQKISVEHYIEKPDTKTKPLSLRFHNDVFLKEFIFELAQAYAVFQRMQHPSLTLLSQEGSVFHNNQMMELMKGVNDSYKEGLLKKI